MIKQAAIVVALAVIALGADTYCKRQTGYTYSLAANGWDKCDSNGLACCYYVNGSVIIYSHNYNNGSYNPNTHCEYIIDIDEDCDLHMCIAMDFSMDGGDSIKITTMDASIEYRGEKSLFNANLGSNAASLTFRSDDSEPLESGSKWAIGFVCVPKTEYRSVCEVCEDLADQIVEGPEDDEVVKAVD